jgi:hypothetical protein
MQHDGPPGEFAQVSELRHERPAPVSEAGAGDGADETLRTIGRSLRPSAVSNGLC